MTPEWKRSDYKTWQKPTSSISTSPQSLSRTESMKENEKFFFNTVPEFLQFLGDPYLPSSLILCELASKGEKEKLQALFESNTKLNINEGDYDQRRPLHLAVEEGHFEVVKFLIEKGADVNAIDRWGGTPLGGSIKYKHKKITQLLIENGAKTIVEKMGKNSSLLSDNLASRVEDQEHARVVFTKINALFESKSQTNLNKDEISYEALQYYLKKNQGLSAKRNRIFKNELDDIFKKRKSIEWKEFSLLYKENRYISRALRDELVIRNWEEFCEKLVHIFEQIHTSTNTGQVASYIPELACVDPEKFGISICTIDGQSFSYGDYNEFVPVQSCIKPLVYSIAIEEFGYDHVHQYVGKEPSGSVFNAFELNYENKPHNACINAGAISVCALFNKKDRLTKFKELSKKLNELSGGEEVGFNQTVYLSEKDTANRNRALANYMASRKRFPTTDIEEALNFYFQCCSINASTRILGTIASTYANCGINPLTNQRVLFIQTVKRTLQLMYNCGMYDYSGEWSGTVGLPAKSGVAGIIWLVIPQVLGICIWSPPLDEHGNSARGVKFAQKLADLFGWNVFDRLYANATHID